MKEQGKVVASNRRLKRGRQVVTSASTIKTDDGYVVIYGHGLRETFLFEDYSCPGKAARAAKRFMHKVG